MNLATKLPRHVQVKKRDDGVCAECCVDTKATRFAVESSAAFGEWVRAEIRGIHSPSPDSRSAVTRPNPHLPAQLHYWEMDHIIEVQDGGGACGLENLRTLCIPCHRKRRKKT